jgi:hypothetical protein
MGIPRILPNKMTEAGVVRRVRMDGSHARTRHRYSFWRRCGILAFNTF